MNLPSHKELLASIEQEKNNTYGSDKYVVQAIGILIQSKARIEEAISSFEKSTIKTEDKMMKLTKASNKVATAQLILAIASLIITLFVIFISK